MTDTLERMARPVPRYTSYPTAPHFGDGVGAPTYEGWLSELADDASLSLYLHVPFCRTMCWYCGCETRAVRRYDPVRAYLDGLEREIAMVGERARGRLAHVHWGGGTPSMLTADDVGRFATLLDRAFERQGAVDLAVEFDPREMNEDGIDAWFAAGLTRASIGVQDVNPRVQAAIGRPQPVTMTRDAVARLRGGGVSSISADLVYGLPAQNVTDVERSVDAVAGMGFDRVAVFGYAHVPWMRPHQRLIDETLLPDAGARLVQSQAARERLEAHGYVAIGLDHFAAPHDPLARLARSGGVRRNFQGYTTDAAQALIGLGASAIGRLPQGYVQNERTSGRYLAALGEGRLPVARGHALTRDDRVRAHVIERLLCDFEFDAADLQRRFGSGTSDVLAQAEALARTQVELGLQRRGSRFVVDGKARAYIRTLASRFDAYLGAGQARHSTGV